MAVQIITDSTSDLTAEELRELGVHVIHMRVIFEDGVYTDGVDITKEEFYAKQAEAKVLPKTTQVNPGEFCDAFQPLLDTGDEVVAILLSSKLSGSFQSAVIAKDMVEGAERLHLVDSLNVTLGEGLLVREAVRLRDAGKSGAEIAAAIEALRSRVRFVAFVGTLKYLKMGGRVSATTALLGTMLSIKPIMHTSDEGKLVPVGKARGRKAAIKALLDKIETLGIHPENQTMFICHADCELDARAVAQQIKERFGTKTVYINYIGPVIGSHTGPNTMGIFFVGTQR